MGEGPLVVACLRHTDLRPTVDPLTGAVGHDPRTAGAAPQEEAALEHALRIAAARGGRVLAVVAGPPDAGVTLRAAAALGADVLRVPWPAADHVHDLAGDERALAAALAAAIRSAGDPAVVVCGDRSADRGTGALPAYLAHELGAAQALGLVRLAVDGPALVAERRLDGGRRERLRHEGGAIVCSVEAAGVRLRRASLPASLAAARTPVPVAPVPAAPEPVIVGAARPYQPRTRPVPPPAGDTALDRLLALTGAQTVREPPTLVGPVDADEAADALLAYLRRHEYVD